MSQVCLNQVWNRYSRTTTSKAARGELLVTLLNRNGICQDNISRCKFKGISGLAFSYLSVGSCHLILFQSALQEIQGTAPTRTQTRVQWHLFVSLTVTPRDPNLLMRLLGVGFKLLQHYVCPHCKWWVKYTTWPIVCGHLLVEHLIPKSWALIWSWSPF